MANTKIVLNRQSDLILDNALITNPQGIVLTDISGVTEAVASINSATSTDMSTEVVNRVAGDASLAANLSTEISTEASARATAIDNEQSARIDGDQSLQNQIDFITSNTDAAAIDSLTEIVAAFQSADGDINGAITTLGSAATVAVDNEASIRLAADQSLFDYLNNDYDDHMAEYVNLKASLEESARESADASLEAAKLDLAGGTMSGSIDMNGSGVVGAAGIETNSIDSNSTGEILSYVSINFDNANLPFNLPAPTDGGDATNKTYVDDQDALKLSLTGGTMSGAIDMGGNEIDNAGRVVAARVVPTYLGTEGSSSLVEGILDFNAEDGGEGKITNLPTPTDGGDATNKDYVDAADTSIAADLSTEIESLAATDELTIELNTDDNTIRLKETVAAPDSGVRTFLGEVDVESALYVDGVDVMETLSSEVSRAEAAEASLDAAKLDLSGGTLSGNLDFYSPIGTGLNITNVYDVQTEYLQVLNLYSPVDNRIQLDSNLDLGGDPTDVYDTPSRKRLRGLPAPVLDGDATNKLYVDTAGASIMSIVNNVISNTDATALDSLTEIVAAFQSADGDINGAITNLANAATTDLSAEVDARVSADSSLEGYMSELHNNQQAFITEEISTELSSRVSTDESLAEEMFNLHSNQQTFIEEGISAEVSTRESADASIVSIMGLSDLGSNVEGFWLEYNTYIDGTETYTENVYGWSEPFVYSTAEFNAEYGPSNLVNFEEFLRRKTELHIMDNQERVRADSNDAEAALSTEVSRAESAEASLEAAKLDLAGGAMSGSIDMGGNNIENVDLINSDLIHAGRIIPTFLGEGEGDTIHVDNTVLNFNNESTIVNLPAPTDGGDATNKTYVDDADASLESALSAEISRAESAEASIAEELSSEVSYIIANTDLTSIDSFAEVVADMSSEVLRAETAEASLALDFVNIYSKKVALTQTANGVVTEFSLVDAVREGSEIIYLNGLSLDSEDYTANIVDGMVSSVTFFIAPSTGDKVKAYGVY